MKKIISALSAVILAAASFGTSLTASAETAEKQTPSGITYSDIGVTEYWAVDLERRAVVRYLRNNDYAPEIISYPDISKLSFYTYPLLEINLSDIF